MFPLLYHIEWFSVNPRQASTWCAECDELNIPDVGPIDIYKTYFDHAKAAHPLLWARIQLMDRFYVCVTGELSSFEPDSPFLCICSYTHRVTVEELEPTSALMRALDICKVTS